MGLVAIAVGLYFRERFSIEAISVGIVTVLLVFFHFFPLQNGAELTNASLLSGFAAPALITIMALLVVGQGMFHTGALEGPILHINNALTKQPRRTLALVFALAFGVSMFMNNTPVVVMFIPVLTAMAARTRTAASRYLMPLSFICILAGMTTLIGSSTNLLVNDVLQRYSGAGLSFFTQTGPGLILAAIGAIYIIFASPFLLPNRSSLEDEVSDAGRQYIAQIRVTDNHPLENSKPVAGLYPALKNVTVRMVQRGEMSYLPPFEDPLQSGDILIVAATRDHLSKLLSSSPRYLEGMLNIAGFHDESRSTEISDTIVISEAVIAPGSRMIGRNIEQVGFRRQTGCLVLGIQRRSRMIRTSMLDIRLEAGDVLLLFGYETDIQKLRNNRDVLLLDWSTTELPDIRKSLFARLIFGLTIHSTRSHLYSAHRNCRPLRRGGDDCGGMSEHSNQILISAIFLVIAIMTNIISNSATALIFAPIALSISAQTGIDPTVLVLTVIFASNCSFATPIAYQTNLLVMAPGRYQFADFAKFGIPLMLLIWVSFSLMLPVLFNI